MTELSIDLADENVRLACKRIVALVRWCQNRGRPFPRYRTVSEALGVHPWTLAKYVNTLIQEEIIIRPRESAKARFLRVNN